MQKSKVIVKNKTRVNSQTQGTFWGDKGGRCPDNRVICKNYQRKIEIVKSWKMQNQFCQFDDGGGWADSAHRPPIIKLAKGHGVIGGSH